MDLIQSPTDTFTTVSGAVAVFVQHGRPVSANTIRAWSDRGRLRTVRTDGGVRLFLKRDLLNLVTEMNRDQLTA